MSETTGVPAPRAALGGRRRWVALGALCLVQAMLTIDDTIVNVALPSIRRDLGFSVSGLAWVADAYWLLFGGFLLLGGRAGDLVGRRRLLLAGLSLFTVASLVDGLALSPTMLVVSRGAQGFGSALASPGALALITLLFRDPGERAKALGVWGGIAGMGGALGVLLGGAITQTVSWRWIFLINVPIGLVVLLVLPRLVDADRPAGRRGFDTVGAVTVTAGLLALVYAVLGAARRGWSAPVTVALLVGAAVLLAVFLAWERRHPRPLVPVRFLRNRTALAGNLLGLLTPSAFAGMFFLLTLYLQGTLHYGALRTGLCYLVLVAAMLIAIPLGSNVLLPRLGARPVLVAGSVVIACGLLTFTRLPLHGHYWLDVAPGLALVGFGAGWAFIAVTLAAVATVDAADTGLASGMINAAQQIGGAVALAVWVAVATARTDTAVRRGVAAPLARLAGDHGAFAVGAAIAATAALLALIGLRRLRPEATRRAAAALHG